MTCSEFRRLNVTDAAFCAMTVAERAACGNHYNDCRSCKRFIETCSPDHPNAPIEKVIEDTLNLLLADLKDPEAR